MSLLKLLLENCLENCHKYQMFSNFYFLYILLYLYSYFLFVFDCYMLLFI